MIRVEIPGRFPTLNQYRNAHYRTLHKWKLEWEEVIRGILLEMGAKPLTTPLTLSVTTFTIRERDCDNCDIAAKFFQDTLTKMGLIPDDGPKFIRPLILDWKKAKKGEEKTVFIIQ